MNISEYLLNEIKTWDVVSMPDEFYHGCRDDDKGIDILNKSISGNKWCSVDHLYAGDYPWHYTRNHEATPYLLKLTTKMELKAVERPKRLEGQEKWPQFLKKCFPQYDNYDLSREFDRNLRAHIFEAFGEDVNGYVTVSRKELIVTKPEQFVIVQECIELPKDKNDYQNVKKDLFA